MSATRARAGRTETVAMWDSDGRELQAYCTCVGTDAPHSLTVRLTTTSVCSDVNAVVLECHWCRAETTLT